MKKKLIIFGTQDYAKIVHEYFTYDSPYEVCAFCVDKAYLKQKEFCGLPVVAFEDIENIYPPSDHEMHVAVVYGKMNRLREIKCREAKEKGYNLASYISTYAFIWKDGYGAVKIGEHAFIFEDNTIQPFTTIGDNCILWSGNHIGHESKIGNNTFISSHVVISGHCTIGNNCFIGVNSTLANKTNVGDRCWVSHGCTLSGEIDSGSMVKRPTRDSIIPLDEIALERSLERKRPFSKYGDKI